MDTPILSSLQVPTDFPPYNFQGIVDDCQLLGWVEQRMLEVGRTLTLISNGQESLLLSYLAMVRDFESTPVNSRRKDRTARELSRLRSSINYFSRNQIRSDVPKRTRGDKSNPG